LLRVVLRFVFCLCFFFKRVGAAFPLTGRAPHTRKNKTRIHQIRYFEWGLKKMGFFVMMTVQTPQRLVKRAQGRPIIQPHTTPELIPSPRLTQRVCFFRSRTSARG